MKKFILAIVMLLLTLNITAQSYTPITFIEKYSETALELMNIHNIPASVILAISLLESGYGTSRLSRVKNNYFGIKSGNYYKEYNNDMDSFDDFCLFISNRKYYDFLIDNNIMDYQIWLNKIAKAGYAEDPEWSNKVLNYIKKYKLYEFDKQEISEIINQR